ncbi:MAG: signal peptidase I [Clostridia bacterium]|nr:signal peptidase I [Clostridia bacterium]
MNQNIKKLWNILTTVIVAVSVLLAVLLVGVRLFGIQVFTVLSGSMEPKYPTGSLIYVRSVDTAKLEVGDVITFMLDAETVATHRIVEIVPAADDPTTIRFRTKGDANEAEDGSLIHYKNVIGSPVFMIPKLGYLASYIQHPPGTYVAISVGAILLILVFLPDLFGSNEGEQDKKPRKPAKPAPNPKSRQIPPPQRSAPRQLPVNRPAQQPVRTQQPMRPQQPTPQPTMSPQRIPRPAFQQMPPTQPQQPIARQPRRQPQQRPPQDGDSM